MTTLADRNIAALRTNHETLRELVTGRTDEELMVPSGASDWPVAQVLSHLGSGAEISLATLQATLAGDGPLASDFNQGVWDRWNAMSPRAQADGFLESDARLVAAFEDLDAETRESLSIQPGFLPFPLPVAAVMGMRLNESVLHHWDVDIAFDPAATLAADAADLLAEQFAGDLGFLLGFTAKADALPGRVAIAVAGTDYGVLVDDAVSLTTALEDVTATFTGPIESAIRLIAGRLQPEHTPDGVTVTGEVTLDDLRRVFPGY